MDEERVELRRKNLERHTTQELLQTWQFTRSEEILEAIKRILMQRGEKLPPPSQPPPPPVNTDRESMGMLIGLLFFIGGILVTAITYFMAASSVAGGTYIIAWGAIVFGAIRFFKGMFES